MKTLNRTAYTLLVLAIILGMCSCNSLKKKKPFVITGKGPSSDGEVYYYYEDSQGLIGDFYDTTGKYNIGDTIK
jgi:hypothetical protein